MLVVIGIIAVLASVILPALSRAQQKSYQAVCGSNLRQIFQAVDAYAKDYDGNVPPYHNRHLSGSRPPDESEDSPHRGQPKRLHDALLPYTGDARIFFCPADKYAGQDFVPEMKRPYLIPINHLYWSYHVNTRMGADAPVNISAPLLRDAKHPKAPPKVLNPSTVIYALDVGPIHEDRVQIRVHLTGHISTKIWTPAD